MEDAAGPGKSRVIFEVLRTITNERLMVNNNIDDVNGKIILSKSEKLDRWAD